MAGPYQKLRVGALARDACLESPSGPTARIETQVSKHLVVVNPLTDSCGTDFVSAVKEGPDAHEHTIATLYGARGNASFLRGVPLPTPSALEDARARHRNTPFVVLAADDSWNYAVVVRPPHVSFLQDARKKPLVATILTVDSTSLLQACTTNLA